MIATYRYDALGRRVERDVAGGAVTRFVLSGPETIEEFDGSNVWRARYVYEDEIDRPRAMDRADAADVDGDSNTTEVLRFHYHQNALGSVSELSAPTGAVVEWVTYDVYGAAAIVDRTGTSVTSSAVGNPFLFTGREWDVEIGLYHYRARAYDPATGRFVQREPLGYVSGLSQYEYASSSPGTRADPLGLEDEPYVLPSRSGSSRAIVTTMSARVGSSATNVTSPMDAGQHFDVASPVLSYQDVMRHSDSASSSARGLSDAEVTPSGTRTRPTGEIESLVWILVEFGHWGFIEVEIRIPAWLVDECGEKIGRTTVRGAKVSVVWVHDGFEWRLAIVVEDGPDGYDSSDRDDGVMGVFDDAIAGDMNAALDWLAAQWADPSQWAQGVASAATAAAGGNWGASGGRVARAVQAAGRSASRAAGNDFGFKVRLSIGEAMSAGEDWVGPFARPATGQGAGRGSGVTVSLSHPGRVFRLTSRDLVGHGATPQPHFHLVAPAANLHVKLR